MFALTELRAHRRITWIGPAVARIAAFALIAMLLAASPATATPGQPRATSEARQDTFPRATVELVGALPSGVLSSLLPLLFRVSLEPGATLGDAQLHGVALLWVKAGPIELRLTGAAAELRSADGEPAEWITPGRVVALFAGDRLLVPQEAQVTLFNAGEDVGVVYAIVVTARPMLADREQGGATTATGSSVRG